MKRLFDCFVALMILVLATPVLAFVAILVARNLGRPVLFRQQRAGLHGRPFAILKFRTMTDQTDANGNLLPDEDRLPRFGRFLRSTSLDELPELINVLKGEMSLVGPRPLHMHYLPLYSDHHARRHEVRPGITGWAQVQGRNQVDWDTRLDMDVWYVDNRSFRLDLTILARTVGVVFGREGVSAEGHATMPPFTGSGQDRR
ncbi:sugar transferase [Fodinicurvata sp. EGI_FJ10296]|uniref:sugar transferase n=1 Tax=Fodinicurvata sp. EGI_FJ10296 TaxID=3231908 RepID=UPI0034546272